jgi:23S rRNA (cytosine1962-C5)-methyltransferase
MESYASPSVSDSLWISATQWKAFESAGTNAHRVCSLSGAWIERLGQDLLINHQTPTLLTHLVWEWKQREAYYGFSPVRIFNRSLPLRNADRSAPTLLEGDNSLPFETVVCESHVRFSLDFLAGYSVGLFLDQRANRALLREQPAKRVLNTFAYTCSFSVVAALTGAQTLSVDLSRKSLDRGRSNFELNALDPSLHRFLADDVQELLPRLARRKELFDAIILDPPTFSRGNKGRRFRAEENLQSLLDIALEVAAPQARILLSTNCTKLNAPELERIARFSLKTARRNGTLHCSKPLPDFPPGTGSTTLWIHLR